MHELEQVILRRFQQSCKTFILLHFTAFDDVMLFFFKFILDFELNKTVDDIYSEIA